jgi:membrane-associated phospholipid phosphatase
LSGASAHAESRTQDTWDDFKSYVTAPVRWDQGDWTALTLLVGTSVVAYQYDDDVRNHFVTSSSAAKPGDDPNELRDIVPAAVVLAGTWAGAELGGSRQGKSEAWTMLEAAGFTVVSSTALKFAFGRERPNDTDQKDHWFKGGSSFPSMHTSLAFAVGTVLAESGNDNYRWIRRILGYGVGGATAYLRLRSNVHWLSDTVAGAGLGIATADFALNQEDERRRRAHVQLLPTPDGGAMLMFSAVLQ